MSASRPPRATVAAVDGSGNGDTREILRGSLAAFSLWDVLQWVAAWGGEGVLVIREAGWPPAWLHCGDGRLRAVHLPAGPAVPTAALDACAGRIGGQLVARGMLDRAQLRFTLATQAAQGRAGSIVTPVGEIARRAGFLAGPVLEEALRDQAWQRLTARLARRGGAFILLAGRPRHQGLTIDEPLEPLLLRAAQAVDLAAIARGRPARESAAEPGPAYGTAVGTGGLA
jgi:hypothetical protein